MGMALSMGNKKGTKSVAIGLLLDLNLSLSGNNYQDGPPGTNKCVSAGQQIQTARSFYSDTGIYASQSTSGNQPIIETNGCKFGAVGGDNLKLASPIVLNGSRGWTVYLCGSIDSNSKVFFLLGANSTDPSAGYAGVGQIGDGNWYFINDSTGANGSSFAVTGKFAMRMRYDPVSTNLYWIYTGLTTEAVHSTGYTPSAATATLSLIGQAFQHANNDASNIFGGIFAVNETVIPGSPQDLSLRTEMSSIDAGYAWTETIPNQLAFFGDSRVAHMTINSSNLPTTTTFGTYSNYGVGGTTSAQTLTSIPANPAKNKYAQYNVACVWTGVNDWPVGGVTSYSVTAANVIACIAAAKQAGYNVILMCTEIDDYGYASPTGTPSQYHDAVNPIYYGSKGFLASGANGVIDLAATVLGIDGQATTSNDENATDAAISITAVGGAVTTATLVGGNGGSSYLPNATFDILITGGGGKGCILNVTTNGSGVITTINSKVASGTGYTTTMAAATKTLFTDGIHPTFGTPGDATSALIYPAITTAVNTAT